jgi:M6 family metalloprotease-like protein
LACVLLDGQAKEAAYTTAETGRAAASGTSGMNKTGQRWWRAGVRLVALVALGWVCLGGAAWAAPFAKRFTYTQPDGTVLELWGEGDEFHAVFETLDGHAVVFEPRTRSYQYARLSADGAELEATGAIVGQANPQRLGLPRHARITAGSAKQKARARRQQWDRALDIDARWKMLKQNFAALSAPAADQTSSVQDVTVSAPPTSTTTGTKVGLCLLVDFSDDPATVPQADLIDFCNGTNFTGFSNNGSVMKYFQDVSNGLLTYTNVVTIYIRAPQPKTYYNDTTVSEGTCGRLLLNDVLTTMKALPNYTTEILPAFSGLTVDGSSRVVACNVFFAGNDSGVWAYGLWPHSSSLLSSVNLGNGKRVYRYQMTDIGTAPTIGTFCHENGHLLCSFPDEYDYGSDSVGGTGKFCLMGKGGSNGSPSGSNPAQVGAYLKRAAGWATTTELTSTSNLLAAVSASGADFNKFYRYQKPGVSTEYFLVENRQKSGRDANLPAAGIAIWHIDELGDKSNQSTNYNVSHLNYEISLMQADNLWHFQSNANSGDSKDLFYSGNTATAYTGQFNDNSAPAARWWDGTASGLDFRNFGASGTTMTFEVNGWTLTTALLTVLANPDSGGRVAGGGTYVVGTNVSISATASNLWRFTTWNDGSSNATRAVTVPEGGATYTATFVQTAAVISVTVNTNIGGRVTGSGTYAVGSNALLTAMASNNWRFVDWQDGLTNTSRSILVVSNAAYTANFASTIATLLVQANPTEGGRVTGNGTYLIGSNILISATASNQWRFTGWNDGPTNTPRTVTVPSGGATYIANFAQIATISVATSTNLGGSVTGGGTFLVGDWVWITATASNGWQFVRWSDGATDNPRQILVSAGGANFTAIFARTAVITVQASPANAGNVTGGGTYIVDSNAVLTATASNLWRFIRWNDNATNNPRTIVVPAGGATYTANFSPLGTVVVLANPTNSGSASGGGQYLVGSTATVTAVAATNGAFLNWNGTITNNPWSFSVTSGTTVCTANFTHLSTVLTVASPSGGGTVTGGGTYPIGSSQSLTAAPSSGWLFTSWDDGVQTNPRTITVPPKTVTYTAIFTLPSVSLALGNALNATSLPWQTGGDANWFATTVGSRDGLAAQSGAISGGGQTWIQTITNGPASLLFWWRNAAQTSDALQFTVNGQLVAQLTGATDWQQQVLFLGSTNSYTLRWTFKRMTLTGTGVYAGWLDQVTCLPCPYATNVPQLFFQDTSGLVASWVVNTNGDFRFARVLAKTSGWALKATGDIDGDGISDLLFQSSASDTGGWFLNADGSVRDARYWFNIGGWEIKAAGDYEGLGRAQVLFQNASGTVAYWRLDTSGAFQSAVALGNMAGWNLRGAGDLDGDGLAELFWQTASGLVAIWYHNPDGSIRGALAFNTGEWALCGVADVDADGVCDLLWQTPDTRTGGWFMNSNGTARAASFWWPTGGWKLKAAGR